MNNIKQITDRTTPDNIIIGRTITVAGETKEQDYNEYNLAGTAIKLGYCCEFKGIGYQIFLTFNDNTETPFEIGKTGMYEFQPETWIIKDDDTGDIDTYEGTVQAIEYILIPMGFSFVLDYCFAK